MYLRAMDSVPTMDPEPPRQAVAKPPRIREATTADAATLAEFAARSFHDTYAAANTAEDMAAYIAEHFSAGRQGAELADPRMTTLLVEVDGAIAGYAQLRRAAPPAPARLESPVELARIYIGREWQGAGHAGALMRRVLDAARRAGGETLWLCVWERNARAIAFYARCGFTDAGRQTFKLGNDLQDDRLLARHLSDADLLGGAGDREPDVRATETDHTRGQRGMHDRTEWVRETYAAIDRKDADAFVNRFAPDVWVRFGNAEPILGREANRAAFRQFFEAIRAIRHRIDHAHYIGDTIALEFTVTYTRLDGGEVTVPAAAVYELDGELATRFQVYVDQTPLWAQGEA
jgi:diamine N-acetyltransferase